MLIEDFENIPKCVTVRITLTEVVLIEDLLYMQQVVYSSAFISVYDISGKAQKPILYFTKIPNQFGLKATFEKQKVLGQSPKGCKI